MRFPSSSSRTTHSTVDKKRFGELAQLGERLVCNQEVTGSSPVFSTRFWVFGRPGDAPLARSLALLLATDASGGVN